MEGVRSVVEAQARPGVALLDLDLEFAAAGGLLAAGQGDGGGEQTDRQARQEQAFHDEFSLGVARVQGQKAPYRGRRCGASVKLVKLRKSCGSTTRFTF